MKPSPAIFRLLAVAYSLMHLGGATQAEDAKLDIVIRNGRVVDGSCAPWYRADVGIDDGKIVRIGRIDDDEGELVIDATGLVVAPGFIDLMGQTASPMVEDPSSAINLLTQGITTINAGEGASAAPLDEAQGHRKGWTTMSEYFTLVESQGLPVNVVQTVGHTQIRRIVLGEVERRPFPAELEQMKAMVREAMEAGAIGVSTALIYPPAVYARTEEISALVQVAGQYGGRYYTHMRNEGDQLLEAIDEALHIGREGEAAVHIFHLKAAGQQNWGKLQLAIARIKAARAAGEQVTADIYPYVNNGLGIAALIHPRHFTAGQAKLRELLGVAEKRAEIRKEMETSDGWENWYRHAGKDWERIIVGRSNDERYAGLDGQSVAAMARARHEDPWDTFFQLVRSEAFALPETMTEANKILAMQQEFVSFCTDVGPAGGNRSASHPRAFGAFPRLLSRYVRDLGVISLERAVSQASAAAANAVMAYDRGRLAIGLAADVAVFDYEHLADHADFANPQALSTGIKHVVVNGQLVLQDGKQTKARPGRVLRGPGYREKSAAYHISNGERDDRCAAFDRLMQDFLQQHHVPGASLAVTEHGQLVFAKGYGYANVATREPVTPNSLFRIASLSKPVTAVAVLQWIERGKLNLDDKVLEILDYESEIRTAGQKFDPRWRDVTIRQLLQHRGGWDRDKSFDPMFQAVRFAKLAGVHPPADQQAIIKCMLSQQLDFAPGERYAYSNFGYCLLGRVIEQLSEQPYELYVQQQVLAPIGVTTMKIGGTHLADRAGNEVRYYHPGSGKSVFEEDLEQEVPWPYGGWNLAAMDSHGGWIATAVDLAKFAAALDDPDHCQLLNRDSIVRMSEPPAALTTEPQDETNSRQYYSLGWLNLADDHGHLDHWHTGSLPGTATILIRRHDGVNLVALLNSRVSPTSNHLGRSLQTLLQRAADEVF